MIHKWYRGHDAKQKATDNFGIIWITDDPEYAQLYADEYGNEGVVSVLYIDESKLNYADTYYDDDFDVWFPDMAKVKEYQKEGYNCYSFPVSIDGLDCDCIALFDESAIVKIEQMNKNEGIMNSKIKLTETELKKIIAESVKKVLSEIGDTPRGQYAMAAVAGRAHQRGQMARANGNQEEYYKQIDKASDVDNAREDASVKSQNNGQMWGGDAARATSRGYTYGINKEKKRQGMTN